MLILQYVLRWLLYLLTPFALAIFMLPGFAGLGVRFLQQLLAILAWPIGFALTNLVALAVWTDFRAAVGANPQNLGDALYSPLLTPHGRYPGGDHDHRRDDRDSRSHADALCAGTRLHRRLGEPSAHGPWRREHDLRGR